MTILKSKIMRNCLLIGMLLCLFTGTFYSYAAVSSNSAAGASGVTTSDVFFVYPNSLRQEEPNLRGLRVTAENAVLTMESDGEFWSLFQTAVNDPLGGAMTALTDWINGTDTQGADCALSATEDLLSQIEASSELYEFGQYCAGPYQEFYKRAKIAKDVDGAVEDLAEFYLDTKHEKVEGILTAILSDESGAVRELVLQDMDEHQAELLNAIDKGSEGVSEAMTLLKYANRFTELVETVALLDSVEDEMIDYLYNTVTTEDLKEAIQTYRNYKSSNYATYIADKWVKEEVLDGLVNFFEDAVEGIFMQGGVLPSAFVFYKVAKLILKYYGKIIGAASGYGDADIYITTYKSWNYVQELERVLSDKRANIIYNPCTMDSICEYERAYELYVAAVIAFAENAKKANSNAAEGIDQYLGIVEGMRDSYAESGLGPFYAHIQRCKDYLALEENREACRRQTPDNSVLEYTISSEDDITIRTSSNNLEADSIYTASDGNLFYGIRLDGGRLEVACNATVPGNVTASYTGHTLKVAEGASLHIDGNLVTETRDNSYAYTDRKLEVNGSLTVNGNLELYNETLTVAGDAAKLKVNGDAKSGDAENILSGELIFNGGLQAGLRDIGQATVYLNTPADRSVFSSRFDLLEVENTEAADGLNVAASLVLRGAATEEDPDAVEIDGNAPSHRLSLNGGCTLKGKSLFGELRIDYDHLTIAGETEIVGNLTAGEEHYHLKIADGGSLHIDGDFITGNGNSTYLYEDYRIVEIYGKLTVDGSMVLFGNLTIDGDAARLEANGYALLGRGNVGNIQSGELILNGGVEGPWNIGQATVHLNTPAGEEASIGAIRLIPIENAGETGEASVAANFVFHVIEGELGAEADVISGSAPSHRLQIGRECIQEDKTTLGELKVSGTLTITGETEIIGDLAYYEWGYKLNIAEGASLHVGGHSQLEFYNQFGSVRDRRVEVNGSLIMDGWLDVDELTVAGDNARLVINEDMNIKEGSDIQSGVLTFNGGLGSEIEDIGSAEVILTGQNDGSVHLMGLNFERNEASPNMRVVKEGGTVLISPYAEDAPVSAADLTLRNHSFELADGTYDIGAVTLESGSLDLNHSLVFTGNLALNGESAEQSADNSSVVVRGDFSSRLSEGDFSGGVLKAAGDFSADGSDAYRETGSHRTVLDGTGAQTIGMYSEGNHLNILELENASEEGVRFDSDIYVDRLFDHHRRHFTLAVSEEDRFADYDGDGVKDHLDPYPADPGKSALAFAVQAIADQTYTGGELTPELTVIDEENNTLRAGTDYEASFADNTRPGTATAVVTGKGFYTGSEEVRFNIVCHHSWTKWQFVEVPSAEEPGKKERTCEICGEKEEESIPELEAVLTLPANLTKIESEAFSGLTSVDAVRVPETVVEIADDAFEGSDVIIIAPEGSYVLQWAEDNDVLCIAE